MNKNIIVTGAHCELNNEYRSAAYSVIGRVGLDYNRKDNCQLKTYFTNASMVHHIYTGITTPCEAALLLLNESPNPSVISLSTKSLPVEAKQ